MKVSVIINNRAGSTNAALIREKIGDALFRCYLQFCEPQDLGELKAFLLSQIANKTDYFLICGGDGTINTCLQLLTEAGIDLSQIPPFALVRSGTANDLASMLGISKRIDSAARNILEGSIKAIDVIEVEGQGKKSYMLTNGGVGLPALAADLANQFRANLQKWAKANDTKAGVKQLSAQTYNLIKKMGPSIYSLTIAEALRKWNPEDWGLEIDIPGNQTLQTRSALLLINNLPQIGSSFTPAPLTSNSDGTVNLLVTEDEKLMDYLQSAVQIRLGSIIKSKRVKSYELQQFTLRTKGQRGLTFFGDGEILHKDVNEIKVTCLHRGLSVVVSNSGVRA